MKPVIVRRSLCVMLSLAVLGAVLYVDDASGQFPQQRPPQIRSPQIRPPQIPGAGAVGMPGGFNGIPNGFNGMPNGFNGMPNGFNGMPGGINGFPGGFNGMPGGINGMPNGFNGMPNGFNGMPGGIGGMPGGGLGRTETIWSCPKCRYEYKGLVPPSTCPGCQTRMNNGVGNGVPNPLSPPNIGGFNPPNGVAVNPPQMPPGFNPPQGFPGNGFNPPQGFPNNGGNPQGFPNNGGNPNVNVPRDTIKTEVPPPAPKGEQPVADVKNPTNPPAIQPPVKPADAGAATSTTNSSDSSSAEPEKKGKGKVAIAIGAVVFGVLVLGGAVFLMFYNRESTPQKSGKRRRRPRDEDEDEDYD